MYNTKFVLNNGSELYPGYLDENKRKELKDLFGDKREQMRCGCKSSEKLYYRISEDLKIYPEHNNYIHDPCCSRYRDPLTGKAERMTAYIVNEDNGEVTTYLAFNPKDFNLNENIEKEEDNPEINDLDDSNEESEVIIAKDESLSQKAEKKEPKLSLSSLVRSINIDTYTEKILKGSNISSRDMFSKAVYYRMKKVKASRMNKAIGDLTLENDGVRFIYYPFSGAYINEDRGLTKCYFNTIGSDGKIYKNLVFQDTMDKAIKEFSKTYGIEPDQDTMLAGFQYLKKSRSNVIYRVLGRVHLFQVSGIGIYCRSLSEKNAIDFICEIANTDSNIKFWIPAEDENIGGIIQVRGKAKKILLLFRTKKSERVSFDTLLYEPLVVSGDEPVTRERFYEIVNFL